MARTKASVGAKISSGKSSKARCSAAPPPSGGGSAGGSSGSARAAGGGGGGNPVCPRDTPKWQRPITNFFINKEADRNGSRDSDPEDQEAAGGSQSKPKRNIIQSSDEEPSPEKPKNTVLDETIELEPLTGDNSHKIEEYYPKNGEKGKGMGKKTKGKENVNRNIERNSKRERDDMLDEDRIEQVSKKVKVN